MKCLQLLCNDFAFHLFFYYNLLFMTRFVGLCDTAREYILQFTVTYTLMFLACYSLHYLLTGNGFQRRKFPYSRFPNYPVPQQPATHSNTSQPLNCSSLTNSLTLHFPALHCTALTLAHFPAYNISAQTAQKTRFLCCCSIVT
jgi:hypothetical protein